MTKISYAFRSLIKQPFPGAFRCPNCASMGGREVGRKYIITQLRRCLNCELLFRTPTDSEAFSTHFYNFDYVQGDAMNTPTAEEITNLKATNFSNTDRSFDGYIDFLDRHKLKRRSRILDFGCSWGFGSYQFAQVGYDVYSFEIAVNRRNYGINNLGVKHIDDIFDMTPQHPLFQSFDCFFSAHVLEHVPSPSKVIDLAWKCLKPGGMFVAFTPNGCQKYRHFIGRSWHNMWGQVHPNYIDDQFYRKHFSNSKYEFAARDGGNVMEQYELGFIAIKPSGNSGF